MGALLTGGLVFAPRATRMMEALLAGVTISDFLHTAYEAANKAAFEPAADEK